MKMDIVHDEDDDGYNDNDGYANENQDDDAGEG